VLLSRALASCGAARVLGPRRSDGSARAFANADARAEPSLIRPGGLTWGRNAPRRELAANQPPRIACAAVDSTRDINSLWRKTLTLWTMPVLKFLIACTRRTLVRGRPLRRSCALRMCPAIEKTAPKGRLSGRGRVRVLASDDPGVGCDTPPPWSRLSPSTSGKTPVEDAGVEIPQRLPRKLRSVV
jgi:hypothetical protein